MFSYNGGKTVGLFYVPSTSEVGLRCYRNTIWFWFRMFVIWSKNLWFLCVYGVSCDSLCWPSAGFNDNPLKHVMKHAAHRAVWPECYFLSSKLGQKRTDRPTEGCIHTSSQAGRYSCSFSDCVRLITRRRDLFLILRDSRVHLCLAAMKWEFCTSADSHTENNYREWHIQENTENMWYDFEIKQSSDRRPKQTHCTVLRATDAFMSKLAF